MPRDINGVYTLPAGNPVVPGTVISTTWANETLNDIAAALTQSATKGDFGSSLAANGYQKLPSGLIIQWGVVTQETPTANTPYTFSYPIAFPNAVFALLGSQTSDSPAPVVSNPAIFGFVSSSQGRVAWASTAGATFGARYVAIGY